MDLGTRVVGLAARLNVSLPGIDRDTGTALVEVAHQACPYHHATRGNIKIASRRRAYAAPVCLKLNHCALSGEWMIYQLIRQSTPVAEQRFEIEFLDPRDEGLRLHVRLTAPIFLRAGATPSVAADSQGQDGKHSRWQVRAP